MGQELTTANKILIAAARIDEEGGDTFTAEDLIVRAWTDYPESFGLTGYRERYPDSNRVLSKLMGSVGLCSRGWLEQVSTKLYRMTPGGRKFAQSLRDSVPSNDAAPLPPRPVRARVTAVREVAAPRPLRAAKEAVSVPARVASPPAARTSAPPPEPVRAPVVAEPVAAPRAKDAVVELPSGRRVIAPPTKFDGLTTLQRLVMSVASQKFTRGGLVTFADSCAFWGVLPANPAHLNARMIEIDALLKRAEAEVQSSGAPIRIHDRLEVSLTTVIGLQGLHRMLRQKYQRELDAMKARAGD